MTYYMREIADLRDECLEAIGVLKAVRRTIDDLENISYDLISEEDYDEFILQSENRLYQAQDVLSETAEGYQDILNGTVEDEEDE